MPDAGAVHESSSPLAAGRAPNSRLRFLQRYGILVALVVLIAAAEALYSGFLAPVNIRNILSQNAAIGIVAVGMTIVMIGGGFDLSVGSVYALGATLFAGLSITAGVPIAAIGTIAAGLVLGAVNGIVITRLRVNPFIATLGSASAISGIAYIYSNANPFIVNNPDFSFLGDAQLFGLPMPAVLLVAAFVIGGLVLSRTVYGREIYALGGNREAARLSGLRVDALTVTTYIVTGTLAAFAGMIDASRLGVGQANVGGTVALDVIAAVVVGGTSLLGGEGAIWRTAIGLLTLATLTNLFYSLNVNQNWQLLAKGLIVIGAVALDAALRSRSD